MDVGIMTSCVGVTDGVTALAYLYANLALANATGQL